jgi:hypothetical protein
MEKETIVKRMPAPKGPKGNGSAASVRTMSMEKARALIRKTTKQHAELFRRLAR